MHEWVSACDEYFYWNQRIKKIFARVYSRIKASFIEYYTVITSIGVWSNPLKPEEIYNRFVHVPTEIIIIFNEWFYITCIIFINID